MTNANEGKLGANSAGQDQGMEKAVCRPRTDETDVARRGTRDGQRQRGPQRGREEVKTLDWIGFSKAP